MKTSSETSRPTYKVTFYCKASSGDEVKRMKFTFPNNNSNNNDDNDSDTNNDSDNAEW